jgi:hypothetical protein
MLTKMPGLAALVALGLLVWAPTAVLAGQAASPKPGEPHDLSAHRVMTPPKLDGVLDDEAWSAGPQPLDVWMSYNPLRGEKELLQTQVWIAYDDKAIYFAFKCLDPEPDKIRTTISRRDNVWNDDWVGVSLDSSRAGQMAYHMFINPSGIQMDALQTRNEDTAVDWTWQSAGRVDAQGYTVEVRLPLQSIRFKGGDDVRMGALFFRKSSRHGLSWSWPAMPEGEWVFENHAQVAFGELHQPLLLEVIPSSTVSRNESRPVGQADWVSPRSKADFGASVKYGITSTTTLDATINPDFSQVESDAFEVEVNNRFPIFFSEKRPFFMEGFGLFNLAGTGGDSSMRTAVHTRRIVDPLAGAKLTGTSGKYTWGALVAPDASVGEDQYKVYSVGRAVRNFGDAQYIGALVTDTEFRSDHNRVVAADISLRHGKSFRWNGSFIGTESSNAVGERSDGLGGQASYSYDTRRYNVAGQFEHFDPGFRMDTAFVQRVGLTRAWQYQALSFYPTGKRYGWIRRVNPFIWMVGAKDKAQGGDEFFFLPALRFNFTRQGYLRVDKGMGHEYFAHQRFRTGRWMVDGGAQWTKWLNLGGNFNRGPAVFYNPLDPFQGRQRNLSARIGLQPNTRLNNQINYTFVHFARETTGATVYDVHIINLRNTYQFNKQFLIRAITQYDSSRRRVLGDFLASYELSPGTVVHAGYGSLWERLDYNPYQTTARAFFFKASYLAHF